jgi:hypothetical protein
MMLRLVAPLSRSARSLLEQERALQPEAEALRQRVLERARAALDAAPALPTSSGDRPSGVSLRSDELDEAASRPRKRALGASLLIAAALAVAGLAVARSGVFERPPTQATGASPSVPAARAPLSRAPEAPAAPPASAPPSIEPALATPRSAAAPSDALHASNASTYALELGLLEPARSSIARGDFGAALAAIARHQREYPRGQLAEEREAFRVRAWWGMGQKSAAERAATAFRKRYPRSALLSWMKSELAPP